MSHPSNQNASHSPRRTVILSLCSHRHQTHGLSSSHSLPHGQQNKNDRHIRAGRRSTPLPSALNRVAWHFGSTTQVKLGTSIPTHNTSPSPAFWASMASEPEKKAVTTPPAMNQTTVARKELFVVMYVSVTVHIRDSRCCNKKRPALGGVPVAFGRVDCEIKSVRLRAPEVRIATTTTT